MEISFFIIYAIFRADGQSQAAELLFRGVTGRFVREAVSLESGAGAGRGRCSVRPLRSENLRLRAPLEPQKAAGNSVRLPMQPPLRQLRPRVQALVFADRGTRSLRFSSSSL